MKNNALLTDMVKYYNDFLMSNKQLVEDGFNEIGDRKGTSKPIKLVFNKRGGINFRILGDTLMVSVAYIFPDTDNNKIYHNIYINLELLYEYVNSRLESNQHEK